MIKDANKKLGDLRAKLPQTNLRAAVVKQPQHHKAHKAPVNQSQPEKEKREKKPSTELERLEAELSAIEGKLKSLS